MGVKVLYVSKAMVVAAYRDKLETLGRELSVTGVIPERWGGGEPEASPNGTVPLKRLPVRFAGHNHLHHHRGAAAVLDREDPDLVHVDEEPYSAVTFQWVRLCRARGVPALFFAWQNLEKRIPPPFGWMRSYVFRRVAGGIAGTERAAEVVRSQGFRGPLAVIPQMGVDPERFRPDAGARRGMRHGLGVGPDDVLVGFGGRLVREKGVELLLDAVAGLEEAVHLVFLGEGPEEERLRGRAVELGVDDRVHVPGRVPSMEMPAWLAALDILALPSLTTRGWVEQFGRIAVEAMACGVPVVGSDSGEIPRVLGEAGVVVPEGEVGALAKALEGLASEPERRKRLGETGRARVLERYTQERVAGETVRFYRGIVEEVR